MILITVSKSKNVIIGFSIHGHAGYSSFGTDIVCSAVSTLVTVITNELEGELSVISEPDVLSVANIPNTTTNKVLLKAMFAGLRDIVIEYPQNVNFED